MVVWSYFVGCGFFGVGKCDVCYFCGVVVGVLVVWCFFRGLVGIVYFKLVIENLRVLRVSVVSSYCYEDGVILWYGDVFY